MKIASLPYPSITGKLFREIAARRVVQDRLSNKDPCTDTKYVFDTL